MMQSTLPWILATLSAAMLLAAAVLWRTSRSKPGQRPLPTEWALSARPVFSTDERRAYRQLREALPHHVILAKLPLVRICQPVDPQEVRYWYELLGATHVSFVICTAHGRVLAAIDLDSDRSVSRRSSQIKQAVLAACRVRYLRCPSDHLPSIPELQLLVPQAATAARGPQAATASAAYGIQDPVDAGGYAASQRRERATLWDDSGQLQDSFFNVDARRRQGGAYPQTVFRPSQDATLSHVDDADDIAGVVIETKRFEDDSPALPTVTAELEPNTVTRAFDRSMTRH